MVDMNVGRMERDGRSVCVSLHAGEDRERIAEIREALRGELEPVGMIEHMWVNDIAVLSDRVEQLRHVQVAVHRYLVWNQSRDGGESARSAAQDMPAGAITGEALPDDMVSTLLEPVVSGPKFERALGQAYIAHVVEIDRLAKLEALVRGERDRVIRQFDMRRRQLADVKCLELEVAAAATRSLPQLPANDVGRE